MKFLSYRCPVCNEKISLKLLSDINHCKQCKSCIRLSPNFSGKIYFLPTTILFSLTLGHFLGYLRFISNQKFGWTDLIFDVVLFYFCYWLIRIILFQFQTPVEHHV